MTDSPKTILFVSDHLGSRIHDGVMAHLKAYGYRVLTAYNALDAEKKIKNLTHKGEKVNAIVTDIHMGGNFSYPGEESGLALAEKLRSGKIVPYGNDIFLIASTADSTLFNRPGANLFNEAVGIEQGTRLFALLTNKLGNFIDAPEKPQIIIAGCNHQNLRRTLQQMIESEGAEMRWAATHDALVDHIIKSGSQLKLLISQFDTEREEERMNVGEAISATQLKISDRTPEIEILSSDEGLYTSDCLMRINLQQPDGWKNLMNGIIATIHGQSLNYDALKKISVDSLKFGARVREQLNKDSILRKMVSRGAQDWADKTKEPPEKEAGL